MVDFEQEFKTRHADWIHFTKMMKWLSLVVVIVMVLLALFRT